MRGTILRVAGTSNSMSSPSISEQVNADVRGWLVLIGLGVLLGAMSVGVLWSAADVGDARDAERARLEERIDALERTVAELQDERRP